MKSKLIIIFCVFWKLGYSQELNNYWGIKIGPNFSTVSNLLESFEGDIPNHKLNSNFLVGYEIGLNYNLKINKTLSFQHEIQNTQYGYKASNDANHLIRKYNLINSNLLINFKLREKKVTPFFVVGPFIGYKLSQYADMVYGGTVLGNGKTDFSKDVHNRFDYGLISGLGLQFKVGKPILNFQGRYQYGFANPTNYSIIKNHSRVISLNFGVLFPILK